MELDIQLKKLDEKAILKEISDANTRVSELDRKLKDLHILSNEKTTEITMLNIKLKRQTE